MKITSTKNTISSAVIALGFATISANAANIVVNGTFEDNAASFTQFFGYYGSIGSTTNPNDATGWTHVGNGGVSAGASGQSVFSNNGTSTGAVLFIQENNSASQAFNSTTNGFTLGVPLFLSFDYNARDQNNGLTQNLLVELIFGSGPPTTTTLTTINNLQPVGGSNPYNKSGFISFTPTTTDFEIKFRGVATGDRTMLIDNVVIDTIPEPSVAILGALGLLGLVARRRVNG